MKIVLLIILTLSYKQIIADLNDNNSINVTLKSIKDVNVKEVKCGHMVKHIYTPKDDKHIIGIKCGNDTVVEVMNIKKNNISSIEVYRSNRGEKIYLIKLFIKSSDVIIYLYEFSSGWRIVKMDFVHYIINKLERGEKFEYPIYTTYQKEGKKFTSSATGTDVNIKYVSVGGSGSDPRILTVDDKVKLKLYTFNNGTC